ncbi:hypothetical protein RIF29_32009 [Crotalaria pallida]|uniref:C2H2-type domain-containing protein n=1 Tax=Crotalaria pallida TaxID=3830 RepID=A0AAN9EIH2_CROPI
MKSSTKEVANCLMLLTKVGESCTTNTLKDGGAFKCKTCDRKFHSFQALGGHRASHNKGKDRVLLTPLTYKINLRSRRFRFALRPPSKTLILEPSRSFYAPRPRGVN